eukprot:CAMPEP_0177590964 /NCGR_PEP_ID=MMETSP0419_2-20121207/7713_1 /TAXON_ID=582737 /ORGANISM="Tetraselmis sp., Strain GSL018" /LENGTH=313 /DNA_ID=CAMNT_0019081611 /DNA_START=70 /DNA_END=1007 /DNA_ORIENTATION=-
MYRRIDELKSGQSQSSQQRKKVLESATVRPKQERKQEPVAGTFTVLFILCAFELLLWTLVKPLGRPVSLGSFLPTKTAVHRSEWRNQELYEAKHAFSLTKDNFDVVEGGSPLTACCPKDKPGADAACLCLPGGGAPRHRVPARPWLEPKPQARSGAEQFSGMFERGFWPDVSGAEDDEDLARAATLPIAEYLKRVQRFCKQKVLSELRNRFAERRLNEVLAFRKRIRAATGCHPEEFDERLGGRCEDNSTQAAKVSKGEWMRQQEEERRREQRLRQRLAWQQELRRRSAGGSSGCGSALRGSRSSGGGAPAGA